MYCFFQPRLNEPISVYAVMLTRDEIQHPDIAKFLYQNSQEFSPRGKIFANLYQVKGASEPNPEFIMYLVDKEKYFGPMLGNLAEEQGFEYELLPLPVTWLPDGEPFTYSHPQVIKFLGLVVAKNEEYKREMLTEIKRVLTDGINEEYSHYTGKSKET